MSMLTAPEHHIVLEILNKRRAWLLNQIKSPEADYNQIEKFKAANQLLGSAIGKIQQSGTTTDTTVSDEEIDFSHLRVLVVEDDKSSAELLKEILSDLKIESIELAHDGNEALTKLFQTEEPYDLVLCDWNMPGKSGLEVHTTLKTDKRFSKLIFILVSAVADGEQIRAAISQGVNDYVVKPIDEAILKKKIIGAHKRLKNKK